MDPLLHVYIKKNRQLSEQQSMKAVQSDQKCQQRWQSYGFRIYVC